MWGDLPLVTALLRLDQVPQLNRDNAELSLLQLPQTDTIVFLHAAAKGIRSAIYRFVRSHSSHVSCHMVAVTMLWAAYMCLDTFRAQQDLDVLVGSAG